MLIIPEIQIQNGLLVSKRLKDNRQTNHEMTPREALQMFTDEGAMMVQIVDIDAALSLPDNNEELIKQLIQESDVPIQVSGGIRTLNLINQWFDAGAARVVLGTVAITDAPLVMEAANRHPGGIIVHLSSSDGFVIIDGRKKQTAFRAQDLIQDLQMTGIAGIIHKDITPGREDFSAAIALTEQLGHDVSIPVYSSGTVHTLDDISRLRYTPNIHGAVISHALVSRHITLTEALGVAAQSETSTQPETITPVVKMGMHNSVRAYMASYTSSQAARVWNLGLRDMITMDNPYMEVTIPQVDIDPGLGTLTPHELQSKYQDELDSADIVIVILEGVENKAWTGFECGYARAKGKYIYGITSDVEARIPSQQRFISMCDELIYYSPSDDIGKSHSEISQALAARVMLQQ